MSSRRRSIPIVAVFVLAVLIVPGFAGAAGIRAQATDPAAVVAAYIAAVNTHDVDDVLDLYAADAVHVVFPPPPGSTGIYTGREQIRTFYDGTAANNDHLEVVAGTLRVSGNTVTYVKRIASDPWLKLGLGTLDADIYAVVEGGRFTTYIAMITPGDVARLFTAVGVIPAAGTPTA